MPSDPLDDYIDAVAAALALPIDPADKPAIRMNLDVTLKMARLVQETGRTGWYYRVLEEGGVAAGDMMRLVEHPLPDWPLTRVVDLLYRHTLDTAALAELAELPQLAISWRDLAGRRLRANLVRRGSEWTVFRGAESRMLSLLDRLSAADAAGGGDAKLVAPMPGKIVAVHVKAGDGVVRGQKLVVLEAMKMEHTILAPADGTVERVRFKVGEQTSEGEELVVFAAKEG